jgi:streptomycin 6-kinase
MIPEPVTRFALEARGAAGAEWLSRLPAILDGCVRRWSLIVDGPFPGLSINYVLAARRSDGAPAVLKICFPDHEFNTEVEALRLFDGRGSVRLLECDLEQGALLLERLIPGTLLETVADDEVATNIAVSVMRRLWRPAPENHPFPTTERWLGNMRRRAPDVLPRDPAFPAASVNRVLALSAELLAEAPAPVLLHGDLHHMNILTAEREPWLAIDPKGVVGPPVWETGPLLINQLPSAGDDRTLRRVLARRTEQLAAELSVDKRTLVAWGVVRAVLSAYWTVEDHGHGWEQTIAVAKALEAIGK